MDLTLKVWRQDGPDAEGSFKTYEARNVSPDASFLEMLDEVNEHLNEIEPGAAALLPMDGFHFDDEMLVPIVSTSLRLTIIVLVLLEIATIVSDKPPSAVIAGLGAGGLAIGLAAQDTIKNFFGSVTVLLDRPFQVGDWVVIGGIEGTVESVGFRSTRIRTFYNSLVTLPNANLIFMNPYDIEEIHYDNHLHDPYDTVELAEEVVRTPSR